MPSPAHRKLPLSVEAGRDANRCLAHHQDLCARGPEGYGALKDLVLLGSGVAVACSGGDHVVVGPVALRSASRRAAALLPMALGPGPAAALGWEWSAVRLLRTCWAPNGPGPSGVCAVALLLACVHARPGGASIRGPWCTSSVRLWASEMLLRWQPTQLAKCPVPMVVDGYNRSVAAEMHTSVRSISFARSLIWLVTLYLRPQSPLRLRLGLAVCVLTGRRLA